MSVNLGKVSLGLALGILCSTAASAWAQPRISAHPLVVEQGRRGERWNALFMRELARQKVGMTPAEEVEAFLEKQEGGSCMNDVDCLRELGYATEAHYILWGGMYRSKDIYTAYARVLLVDGTTVKNIEQLQVSSVSKLSEEANAMAVYAQLFEELKLDTLDPHPPVPLYREVVEKRVPVPVPKEMYEYQGRLWPKEELSLELGHTMSARQKTSLTLLGVAGATGTAGLSFALAANRSFHKYSRRNNNTTTGPVTNTEANPDYMQHLKNRTELQRNVAIIALSVAGASAIAGTTLFFLSPERQVTPTKPSVAIVPVQGGAMLSLQGVLP